MKIVAMMVNTFITSFIRLPIIARWRSSIPERMSRQDSMPSMTPMAWSWTSPR